MADTDQLKNDIREVESVGHITGVLRDIAASRLEDLRNAYKHNNEYYENVLKLLALVRRLVKQRHGSDFEQHGGKRLALAVTSNQRFYGGLNRRIIEYFLQEFDKSDEHIVIGTTGEAEVRETPYANRCEYMSFPEDLPERSEMMDLIERFRYYDTVNVYFPRYVNPFRQVPAVIDVNATPEDVPPEESVEDFIVEPDLPVLHGFFQDRVKWTIFERVMLETDLSRTSARLIKMDSAERSAEDFVDDLQQEVRRDVLQSRDIQLFESIVGHKQWQKLHNDT